MALTPIASRAARLSASVDSAFGETFKFSAFTVAAGDVNLPKTVDGSRAPFIATAIWEAPSKSVTPYAHGSISDDNAHNWTASTPSISVADVNLLWTPQPGDRVTRILDGTIYQISTPAPDGMGRTIFHLSSRKR